MKDLNFLKEETRLNLLSVNRTGMKQLVAFLDKTDYYTAPASSKFHLCISGGLLQHHNNIYEALVEKNKLFKLNMKSETMIITALLHDVCKCGLYRRVGDTYEVNKSIAEKGHAKLSLKRIKKFIALTDEEEAMIKFHMGTFGVDNVGYLKEYPVQEMHDAIKRFKLVQVFASTDMEVSIMEGAKEKKLTTEVTTDAVMKLFRKLDVGYGVFIEDVLKEFQNKEKCELIVNTLKKQGEIFEIKPSKYKILE